MRTGIFVDGYNLYYGALKDTSHKWLNIHGLFSLLVKERVPESQITVCRYYTALVKAKIASHGNESMHAQNTYHRALESPNTPDVTVIKGDHNLEAKPLIRASGSTINKDDRVRVWTLEEKQTDVRIALDGYRFAAKDELEHIVLVSNDTDLVPLLEALKEDFPLIKRGVIFPIRNEAGRPASTKLSELADWTRTVIHDSELNRHQFSDRIGTKRKPAIKPRHW